MKSEIETMEINGEEVSFVVKDLGYNYGDPIRNGTIVEISSEESFCRLSDGDAGKVALYELHQKSKASAAAAEAYLDSLFPGMERGYYFPSITDSDGKHPSPPVLYTIGVGPSEDGKRLYVKGSWWRSFEEYHFKERWNMVHRYWTSYNMCKKYGVKFRLEYVSSTNVGIPQIYKTSYGKTIIRVQDADLDGKVEDTEYFNQLIELIDQLKGE